MGPTTLVWFRRDLRLADHPALVAAVEEVRSAVPDAAGPGRVVGLFVLDPRLWAASGEPRRRYLRESLRALDDATGGRLVVRTGDPRAVVVQVAREAGAATVHVSATYEPYGSARDEAVRAALADHGVGWVATGSSYAVAPGRLLTGQGTPYRVFTPFRSAWLDHGWRAPAVRPREIPWLDPAELPGGRDGLPGGRDDLPADDATAGGSASGPGDVGQPDLPRGGEAAARERWHAFLRDGLAGYATDRDRPDVPGTSRASVALKWGELHPRTMLADLAAVQTGGGPDAPSAEDVATFRSELAWREFHADVLHHRPSALRTSVHAVVPDAAWTAGEDADRLFAAWAQGRTGYPLVDAGMRQLLGEGWMHNRVRMVVASFLVKDLHVRWQRGADHFMAHLVDGDLPQNQLNWQWVAGTGFDAAPYFRIFNPVTQGLKFDPDGDYVRRWVPELRDVPARFGVPRRSVHEPWKLPAEAQDELRSAGYPDRVVDHAEERRVSLDAYGRR